jgi:putative redox protein
MGNIAVKWMGGQLMVGVDSFGHPLVMGSWPEREPEWAGLKPSDLLMLAAGGCAAPDVVLIMKRQHQPMEGLEVACAGEQQSEPPYAFTSLHLHFITRGPVSAEKLKRAIALSENKYCSVIATLRPTVAIVCDFEIVDE